MNPSKPPIRLGILTTHPIQYQVPWFRLLADDPRIELEVLFCMIPDAATQGAGFGVAFEWDLPLLDGYRYRVLDNRASAPSVTRFDGCDTPDLERIVREEKWDAFIVNGWVVKSCLQLLLACRRNGVPCIVRGEVNGLRHRALWKRLLHRLLFTQYAGFLAIGSRNREYLLGRGVAESRIWMTPYCVDNDLFPIADRADDSRRAEPFRFLFSGKLETKKRPLDLVAACRQLRADVGAGFEVLFVGDGALRPEVEAAVREGLPIRLLGFVNQSRMAEVYAQADCLVLPSDSGETWGLVVNEAMATGLPAIVSDAVGCAIDLVEQDVTGAVFPLGNVEALAGRMARVMANRADALEMGRAAAARVRSGYTQQGVAEGVKRAVDSIAGAVQE